MPLTLPRPRCVQETDWLILRRSGTREDHSGRAPFQVISDWQKEHLLCRILWTCIRIEASFNFSGVKQRDIRIKIYYRTSEATA